MALTKVQKTGITDNAIDADKIEDGTIVAADIAPGTITNAKLAGSIANDKLANSSITVNGSSVSLGGSVSAGKVQWQAVKTADFNAVAGEGYFVDTDSVGAVTATLPGSPSAGDTIAIKDYAGTFGTNALTIARNGNNIQGVANDSQISTNRASVVLVYIDATKGWLYTNESNVADLENKFYVTATGGTITTSGDFKIHTFTGDGCFVVSCAGNSAGSDSVDYLVVAGGGGGGGAPSAPDHVAGGGGAGGLRTTFCTPASALTVTVTSFPITVGGGGTGGGPGGSRGTNGSNSVFSTITSAGGGTGGAGPPGPTVGEPGGSGGGGSSATSPATPNFGTGNTPPVSPPQGNNGGSGKDAAPNDLTAGGGGGASAAGADGSPPTSGGPGGNGIDFSPFVGNIGPTSSVFAGGGGGAKRSGTQGTGGTGGGGPANSGSNGDAGTTNTGGGGGGTAAPGVNSGGAGGKGIVIIRYKFQ